MSKRGKLKVDDQEKINVRERLTDNVLDLSLMNISTIPVDDIKPLKRATVLDLSNNIITIINKDFSSLVQLTKLDLSKNKIKLITDDFGNLVNLRHLDLYNNQIERLPLSFGRLKKLKYLDLKNNPLNPGFSKIVGTCTDQRDCIEAARKAVSFMADIEQQVLEERRKEREQKDMEIRQLQEKAAQEIKLQEKQNPDKKKKNKNKKSKADNNGREITKSNELNQESVNIQEETTKTSFIVGRNSTSSKRWILYLILLTIIVLMIFSGVFAFKLEEIKDFFDRPYTEILEEYIK